MPTSSLDIVSIVQFFVGLSLLGGHNYLSSLAGQEILKALGSAGVTEPLARKLATLGPNSQARVHSAMVEAFARALDELAAKWKEQEGADADVSCFQKLKQWTPDQVRLEPLKQGLELHVALSNTLLSMLEGVDPKLRQFLQARLAKAVEPHFYNALALEPQAWARIQIEVFQKLSSGLDQLQDQQKAGLDALVHRLKALESRLNRHPEPQNTSPITGEQLETWMKQTHAALQVLGTSGEQWGLALAGLDKSLNAIDVKVAALTDATKEGFEAVTKGHDGLHSVLNEHHADVKGMLTEVIGIVTPPPPAFTLLHVSTPRWSTDITADQRQAKVDEALVQARQLAKSLGPLDLLVLSGTAGMGEDGTYKETRTWLDKLHKCLHLDAGKVLIVPGPNDVERGWLSKNPAAFSMRPLLRSMPELFEQFLQAQSSAQFETTLWPKLRAYSTFAHAYPLSHLTPAQPWVDVSISPKPEFGMVELRGLNTCLLAFDDDPPGCLALGQRQLDAVNPLAPDLLALIVLGHPLEHLRDGKPLRERVDLGPALLLEPTHGTGIVFRALQLKQGQLRHFEPNAGWQEVKTPLEGLHVGGPLVQWLRSRKLTPPPSPPQPPPPPTAPRWEVWVKHTFERNRYLELAGIRRPSQNKKGIKLEHVYVELRAENIHDPTRNLAHSHHKSGPAPDDARMEVLERSTLGLHEVLQCSRRLLILGDPGCGKTTLLRYVARKLAMGWLAEHSSAPTAPAALEVRTLLNLPPSQPLPIPVLVTLASLSSFLDERNLQARTLSEQVVRDFLLHHMLRVDCAVTDEALKRVLEAEGLLLLLDGLDEVPDQADRVRVCSAVRVLLERFPRVPVILTSRTRAFQGGVTDTLTALPRYVVQRMSQEEVARFLQLWFEADSPAEPEQARQTAIKLEHEIKAHRELSQLALNPNILTLVALIRRRSPTAKLPERRVDLYREVIPLFLERRDVDRSADDGWKALALTLDEDEKVSLAARLALEMHEHGARRKGREKFSGARTVPEDVAVRNLAEQLLQNGKVTVHQAQSKAKKLLHWLEERPGLLRLTDDGVEFTHLGYQEFLAAVALSERHLTDEGQLTEVLPRLMDDWWNEPIRLLLTLLEGRAEVLLAALSNAGMTADGKTDWQRQGRGLALAMGAVQDIPAERIPHARALVLRRMDGLLGRESTANVNDRVEALLALGRVGDPRLGLEKPENWIWIPPGEFRMGDQQPTRLSQGFHISRFPVTNHDFKAFVEAGGYSKQDWWSKEGWAFCQKEKLEAPGYWQDPQWNAPNQPVVRVSWYEADAFCRWMSTQRSRLPPGTSVVRLPTEAEWEFAASGKEGRTYPWGNDAPTPGRANYNETGLRLTSPVGTFPLGATPEGLLDMAGNVLERVEDWYAPYTNRAQDDPSGPRTGSVRVLRGGSWFDEIPRMRGADRSWGRPADRVNFVGFRVVVPLSRRGSQ